MPKPEDIKNGLQKIVNDYSTFAIIWHIIFYLLIAAIILFWNPSNRLLALVMCLPVLSVSIFAWITGNPFNGSIFLLAVILLGIFGLNMESHPIAYSQPSYVIAGIIIIAFGLVYPHFIKPDFILKYFYLSPVGLIPCPTLSVIIGFALVFNGFNSQPMTLIFIIIGLFYGIFGVLKLRVYLDMFLIFGLLFLLIKYLLTVLVPTL